MVKIKKKETTKMGGGYWDTTSYHSEASTRKLSGVSDFQYSQQNPNSIHPGLNPARIATKPFHKLESRDNADHPESNPVFVMFDVTGSNYNRAVEAQKRLPNLMELLTSHHYLKDPQILVAANDDFHFVGNLAFQVSDFESDNRIDQMIRNINLVGKGGGNKGESYDLGMYCAAYKTILDSMEKRGKKGYFFMYADEPIFPVCSKRHIKAIFGDDVPENIPIETLIEDLKKLYEVFVIWPVGGYAEAYEQYVHLFGQKNVLTLQDPNLICELIGSVIGVHEGVVGSASQIEADLSSVGVSAGDIATITSAVTIDRAIG